MSTIPKELIGAVSVPIILSVLKNSDSYGYDIVQKVKELSNGQIHWHEASIYPVLKKLESGGMIKSYWKINEGERPRKYYTILDEGKKQMEQNLNDLERVYSLFVKLGKLEA